MSNNINESFIMYLPSDSNMELNPNNKPSNFTVQLNETLLLDRKMEVGILEIILTNPEFKLLKPFEFHIVWCYKTFPININEWDFNEHRIISFKLPEKFYKNNRELLKEMKRIWSDFLEKNPKQLEFYFNYFKSVGLFKELLSTDSHFNLHFNLKNLTLDIQLPTNNYPRLISNTGDLTHSQLTDETKDLRLLFQFDNRICESMNLYGPGNIMINHMLNFKIDGDSKTLNEDIDYFDKYANFHSLKNDIYLDSNLDILILSDLVEESYLNDRKLNYILHSKCKQSGDNFIKVVNPIYFPVKCDIINSINIKITDMKGNEVIFESGTIVFTLNFRPREII
jgi:hypothetical protein